MAMGVMAAEVKIVDSFEDIKVKIVDAFEGVKK